MTDFCFENDGENTTFAPVVLLTHTFRGDGDHGSTLTLRTVASALHGLLTLAQLRAAFPAGAHVALAPGADDFDPAKVAASVMRFELHTDVSLSDGVSLSPAALATLPAASRAALRGASTPAGEAGARRVWCVARRGDERQVAGRKRLHSLQSVVRLPTIGIWRM